MVLSPGYKYPPLVLLSSTSFPLLFITILQLELFCLAVKVYLLNTKALPYHHGVPFQPKSQAKACR